MEIKVIMKQLFEVLDYLHDLKVLHRDVKSSNLLLTNRHELKLADFGLARSCVSPMDAMGAFAPRDKAPHELTNNVITMWYRPIELLLGSQQYGYAVDIWSAGCVMAELELGRPLFPGKSEAEQIDLICRTLGTPTKDAWPDVTKLPNYNSLSSLPHYSCTLRSTLGSSGKLSEPAMVLLDRVLVLDPERRSSAKMALSNMFVRYLMSLYVQYVCTVCITPSQ
jgi:serine/threonine protein kinase